MLVHAVETYLRRNKEKLKDKLTSSHSKFQNQTKRDFEAFYFSSNIARCGWYVAGN